MRIARYSVHRMDRQGPLVLASAWLLTVSAFGSSACSGHVKLGGTSADAAPPPGQQGSDDAGVGLPADAEAGAPPGAQTDGGPDAEAGVAPPVDASDEPVPSTVARMNDVSILFPLPASGDGLGLLLAPSATGSRGVLFPSDLYASEPIPFSNASIGGPTTYVAYGDLRVVAMRIDPCFASLAPDPHGVGCTAQLRLVFQRVTMNNDGLPALNDGGFADDSAVHVFYDLSRDEFLALARALVALRIANDQGDELGPLAPHPVMVRQGLAGAMSQGVQSLILQYAGEENLVRMALAFLAQDVGGPQVWLMSIFDVGGAPKAPIPLAIPSVTDADGGSVFLESILAPFFGRDLDLALFFPTTTSADNITSLGYGDGGDLAASDRQAALDALVRVENPRDNSADTIDCLSCHMATPLENFVARPLFSFDDTAGPLAYQPDGTIVTRADMSATPDPNLANIHAFSYLGQQPQISQRVVNETAAVVDYLNDLTP
jgi:hypothetical protein